jgi:hypothetical protein
MVPAIVMALTFLGLYWFPIRRWMGQLGNHVVSSGPRDGGRWPHRRPDVCVHDGRNRQFRLPTSEAFKHVPKQLPGLDRFYMAGQWVEPGGGVPTAIMSGRHVVELVCAALRRPFTAPVARREQAAVVRLS